MNQICIGPAVIEFGAATERSTDATAGNCRSDHSKGQGAWQPPMDIIEYEESYRIDLDLPGIELADLGISYVDEQLQIKGLRNRTKEGEDSRFVRRERELGEFRRVIRLSKPIRDNGIQAFYKQGVLTIRAQKAERAIPKSIEIRLN